MLKKTFDKHSLYKLFAINGVFHWGRPYKTDSTTLLGSVKKSGVGAIFGQENEKFGSTSITGHNTFRLVPSHDQNYISTIFVISIMVFRFGL